MDYKILKTIKGSFAAQLKAERSNKGGGRHLQQDEIFGNEANLEDEEKKKVDEDGKEVVKKEEEQPPVRKTKIMRRNDKKIEEENKDNAEKANSNGIDQEKKKEPQ